MKTSELIGPALDWAVAKCDGEDYRDKTEYDGIGGEYYPHRYSTDWAQGGPLIEREAICLTSPIMMNEEWWGAHIETGHESFSESGPTALITAMRCFVASKLGDDVDIPNELI